MNREEQKASYKNENMGRGQEYVEGNTVRKLEPLPLTRPQEETQRQKQQSVHSKTETKREPAVQMGFGYAFFFTVAIVLIAAVGVMYIRLQTENNNRISNIASMQSQILKLKTVNDAELKRIEAAINLEEVKEVAIQQMGMVYPSAEQIEYIEIQENDYMNQYQDIPEK